MHARALTEPRCARAAARISAQAERRNAVIHGRIKEPLSGANDLLVQEKTSMLLITLATLLLAAISGMFGVFIKNNMDFL